MIFSISYHSNNKDNAEEIRCPYNQLGLIFDYIKAHKDKRYNIIIGEDINEIQIKKLIEQVEFVKAIAEDYTIECGSLVALKTLINRGYNAYLRFPISDWETFNDLIELGVSDIYIDGPLCFNSALLKLIDKVKLRVSPTVSANSSLCGRRANSFFMRPEDLSLYEGIIDIVDFQEKNVEREEVLIDIYKRGTFMYTIDSLIKGLPQVSNTLFMRDFAETRINCKQKCKEPGHLRKCNYCDRYFSVVEKSAALAQQK